jgi:hypothetical protein
MATKQTEVWAVVYVGAPYGDGEGEVVSRHRTEEKADEARRELQSNPRYYGSNSVVRQVK